MREHEPGETIRGTRHGETETETRATDEKRYHDAIAVSEASHHETPQSEADHEQRIRQCSRGARDPKLRLHDGQYDRDHVHAARADRHQNERDREPRGGVRRIGLFVAIQNVGWCSDLVLQAAAIRR